MQTQATSTKEINKKYTLLFSKIKTVANNDPETLRKVEINTPNVAGVCIAEGGIHFHHLL
jgi:hypothetical protein